MENKSIWINDIKPKINKRLDKNLDVDILIIGGGLTGITSCFYLKDSKYDIALIDADKVGFGVSSRTTGKLTYLQELIYQKLESNFNFNVAKKYLESQKYAINLVVDNIKNYNIDCNLEKNSSYVFTNDDKEIPKFKKEEKFFAKANVKYTVQKKIPVNIKCKYSIKVDDTYVFHPLKYILKLKEICTKSGIKIYENTKATQLSKKDDYYICYTDKYKIKAKKVIIACHYPFFVIPGFIPLKTHIEKSYVTASKVDETKKFNAITNTYPIKSIRYHNDDNKKYVIFAGESHKLCDKLDRCSNYKKIIDKTKKDISRNIDFYWTNQDLMTSDNLPLIGSLNKNNPNLLLGIGYNTWGMTNATLAGKIISDIILNKENKYKKLFRPDRPLSMDKIKNLFVNSYFNGKAFAVTKLKKNYPWYKNKVKFENRNGVNVGIYIDKNGREHIVRNLCPHLKCSLIFNMEDKTWDCPCHGSRFDIDGNCIQEPSSYDIKIK